MLQKLLHPRDDEIDPEALMGSGNGRNSRYNSQRQPYSFKWWHVAAAIAILFPYISIFALFGIVAQDKGTTKKYYTEEVSLTTSYSQTWPSTYAPGT
eukprot:gene36459-44227_t